MHNIKQNFHIFSTSGFLGTYVGIVLWISSIILTSCYFPNHADLQGIVIYSYSFHPLSEALFEAWVDSCNWFILVYFCLRLRLRKTLILHYHLCSFYHYFLLSMAIKNACKKVTILNCNSILNNSMGFMPVAMLHATDSCSKGLTPSTHSK